MKPFPTYKPSWEWGTPEGSKRFDRLVNRQMTLIEKVQWLEEAESLTDALQAARKPHPPAPTESTDH